MSSLPPLAAQRENDYMVVCNVAKILELAVPLMEEPSQDLLLTIEDDLMRLIIKHGVTVSLPKGGRVVKGDRQSPFGPVADHRVLCVLGPQVVQHCVSCLAAVVNQVTHNYMFVWACFNRFYGEVHCHFILYFIQICFKTLF